MNFAPYEVRKYDSKCETNLFSRPSSQYSVSHNNKHDMTQDVESTSTLSFMLLGKHCNVSWEVRKDLSWYNATTPRKIHIALWLPFSVGWLLVHENTMSDGNMEKKLMIHSV